MAEAKVAVEIDASGLEQAMANFQRFSGSASSVQRAMGQFGRMGEGALRTGGALNQADYEKMGRALENIRRTETEITKQIQDRRGALAGIDAQMEKIFSKRSPAMGAYEGMIARGFTPEAALRRALASDMPGSGDLAGLRILEPQARRLHDEIARLEKDQAKIGGSLPHAEEAFRKVSEELPRNLDRTFQRFTTNLGQVLTFGLRIAGIGSGLAIAAQSRSRAIQYGIRAADISGFIGSGANAQGRGLSSAGDYGLYPMEALDVIESLGSAGGPVNDRMISKMAGMGLHFGLGRTGFANMGREAVGRGSFNNFAQFDQFGATAGVLAKGYGLEPAQRTFFLESNKNMIEQMGRWYGGRPLSVENYFSGVNALMMGMRHLNLPAGGGPIATEAMAGIMQSLSPLGKSFGNVMTEGALLGLSPVIGHGQYFGMQRAINDMMQSPAGFLKGIQRMAGNLGIETGPGAKIEDNQLTSFAGLLSNKFPGILKGLGGLNMSGVDIADLLRRDPNAPLPTDLDARMQGILDETKKAAEDNWRRSDIGWTKKEITEVGNYLKNIEANTKGFIGPMGALLLSGASFLGGQALRRVGAGAIGARIGGVGTGAASWAGRVVGLGGLIGGVATLPFTMTGEGMGTTPPKSQWTGSRPMTREEFVQLETMARSGMLPELKGAQRAERPPIAQETLVDALIAAFHGLMIKIGDLSLAMDAETKASQGAKATPERRAYQVPKPGGSGR